MCHQIRFEGSELSWQLTIFSEWPSGGDTSRMSISRLRTTTWDSKLSWPKSRDWGDPKMSYNNRLVNSGPETGPTVCQAKLNGMGKNHTNPLATDKFTTTKHSHVHISWNTLYTLKCMREMWYLQ